MNAFVCEFLGVSVTCFHNYFISSYSSGIIEPVRAMRYPVIDPSHKPPERYTGIDITVCIGVSCIVAARRILEFSLRDNIADLPNHLQLPVSCWILVRQTFKANLYNATDTLFVAAGRGPH
jgi:hypothetical protein